MAIAYGAAIGSVTSAGAGASKAMTTSASVPSGGKIVVGITYYGNFAVSSVSGGSLSWTVDVGQNSPGDASFRTAIASADAPSGLSSGSTITANFGGSSDVACLGAFYITGAETSSPIDATGGAGFTVSTTTASATVTTTNADDLIAQAMWIDTFSTDITPAASMNEVYDLAQTDGGELEIAYRVVSSTGSYTIGGTFTPGRAWVVAGVAYKAATAGGPTGEASTPIQVPVGPGAVGDMAFQWRQIVGADPAVAATLQTLTGTIAPGPGNLVNAAAQTKAGTIATAGALAKVDTKAPFTGTIIPAGALAKQDQKSVAGTITSAGAFSSTKVVLLSLAAAITSVGQIVKDSTKRTIGTINPGGAIVKAAAKTTAGTVTSAGALAKLVANRLAGSITTAGALASIRVILRTLTGTITTVGALAKQAQKTTAGVVGSAGVIRSKAVAKTTTGLIVPAATVVKTINQRLAGAVATVGALTAGRIFVKFLAGVISSIGAVVSVKSSGLPDSNPITGTVRARGHTATVQSADTSATVRARGGSTTARENT
jgi:hypothetical protein